ncbi:LysR family transcriptional regulator [Pokkaliibacter sp. MBI-7]|uniref:LysR family transcriptional regulator n=1 Tax=Pokkaliibacter sp. MBI-7 TaxID=3040600 RepID=UPI00244B5B9D|nr:LysR family transcriptional regulator [Pokkaliibacter sp. MBI-7]MDH2432427.1 LysR family transcriptional regulator [Pokkaliibacter sp. MBI-7]
MPAIERISDLDMFLHIVSGGSLSAAARELNLSLAVISTRLARLEEALGVRLLNRSTRRLSLTEEGAEFYQRAQKLMSDLQDTEEALGQHSQEPRGKLRITCTSGFGRRHIAPRLPKFHTLYPQIVIELLATDTIVDIVKERIDLAIRQANLPDSSLKLRTIAPNRRVVCAAPSYLQQHGTPATPDELRAHRCIAIGNPPLSLWNFIDPRDGAELQVEVPVCFRTNDGEIAHNAALAGTGLVWKSWLDVAEDLQQGALIEVLPEWHSPWVPVQVVYPSNRQQPAKVRAFIDFLIDELASLDQPRKP